MISCFELNARTNNRNMFSFKPRAVYMIKSRDPRNSAHARGDRGTCLISIYIVKIRRSPWNFLLFSKINLNQNCFFLKVGRHISQIILTKFALILDPILTKF